MKTRRHILSSLLILSMISFGQLSFGQEDNFNIPGEDRRTGDVINSSSVEGEQYTESHVIEPEAKDTKEPKQTEASAQGPDNNTPQRSIEKPSQKQKQETAQPPNADAPEEKEQDESVLSFNFLYYMIQKFKFSDIDQ